MNKRLVDVVKNALAQDNTIAVDISRLNEAKGFTQEYLAFLGISKTDLKKLERAGLAIRGYFNQESKTSTGLRKAGHTPMWVLVGRGNGAV